MYVQLNSVIVDPDPANRQEMAEFLSHFGVNVQAQFAAPDQLDSLLSRGDAVQLVIVNLDPAPAEMMRKIAALPRLHPHVSFFVMSCVLDANLLMEAMHLGIREFIPLPVSEEKFAAAIDRVAQGHGMGKRAQVIQVIPTMGGCGSTTIACNIAASMARSGKSALLDFDLVRGAVASSFDIRPRYTIADIIESGEKLDRQLLDNALMVHPKSNLAILARPELPEDAQRITQPGAARLLNVLGRMFDHVVIDSVMSMDPLYTAACKAADINLIVMQLNVPSARNTERYLGALRRMGIDATKIRIVVNRYVKKGWDIDPAEVERSLGLQINHCVPNDFKNAIAAINYGEPVVLRAPRSDMSISLIELAQTLNHRYVRSAA